MTEWLTLYPDLPITAIAKRYCTNPQAVRAYLKRHGVAIRKRGGRYNENITKQNEAMIRRGK